MGWSHFNINPNLEKALNDAGFSMPTDIQEKSLIYMNHPVDLIIASKTVSVFLPRDPERLYPT